VFLLIVDSFERWKGDVGVVKERTILLVSRRFWIFVVKLWIDDFGMEFGISDFHWSWSCERSV
jgi:hypothetical protein